ncbi:MAG: nicotinamide-nucleotide amidohydrolase family protein [Spirochaetaceae bacterium]|jgi:PncC family amidohydrolase|nr:nicotinamide-nucleotide amidohydrolase family protein [Spirochaetaceae bacterium]
MIDPVDIIRRAETAGLKIVTAESCTAGLAAALLASAAGASRVFWGGFVCYTPEAKTSMLGLEKTVWEKYGLVSREIAKAMAWNALERSGADLAVSVTGLAGPGGDGSGVPVGTVWIGAARRGGECDALEYRYTGSRQDVRSAAAQETLEVLGRLLMGACPDNVPIDTEIRIE